MPASPNATGEFSSVPTWFAVLPDCDAARPLAAMLRTEAPQEISHPSGRPWLLGRWPADSIATGQHGQTALTVIGLHTATTEQLSRAASRIRTPADAGELATSLTGSAHLLASAQRWVRAQGTITGLRRLFSARLNGTVIGADRADVLAWLLGTGLDEVRLALHLLHPPIAHPLTDYPVWRGVEPVPAAHYLLLDPGGTGESVRWWTPPDPAVPISEGAQSLRRALSESVGTYTRGRSLISCDLGGVDSTAVCSLAARGDAHTVAYTAASIDPLADDVDWAERTIAGLGTVEHHVIPAERMPLVYHRMLDCPERLDEPCAATADRERWHIIAREAVVRGSSLHLTGFGGDELLYGSIAHLHPLLRTHPAAAARLLRGFTAKYRWTWREVLRQLRNQLSYQDWMRQAADELTGEPPPASQPLLDWGFRPRLPPWTPPEISAALRDFLRTQANHVKPLSENRGQHRELATMRFISRIARQFYQIAGQMPLSLACPYYDDRVVEAGLAVRPQDRVTPWRYKPLLAEAMRGVVPDESRMRDTKANGTCDEEPGMRQNRADLLGMFAESRLGRLGLIDAPALHEMCTRPMPSQLHAQLYGAVACEAWLRSLERPARHGGHDDIRIA